MNDTTRRRQRHRRAMAAGVALALGVGGLLVGSPPAQAAISIDVNSWYVIVNVNSGKALDLYNWSTADGAEFRQWTRTDATNQQFQFLSSGDGYYRLKNRHSGKVVDVWGWSTANSAPVNQYTDHNGANQQWRLRPDGGPLSLSFEFWSSKANVTQVSELIKGYWAKVGVDVTLKPEDQQFYQQRMQAIPDVRHAVVQDASHMLHHDQPAALATLIDAFLQE